MSWINLQDQLPPPNVQVNVAFNNKFYIGYLDGNQNLILTGYTPSGIPTAIIYWAFLPDLPKTIK